ncbi:MAG: hypothetical protein M1561_05335 [Gammaproteobacteria bacterium]|nr:hypothetical protein [Gammaproteobacteria bacterium]
MRNKILLSAVLLGLISFQAVYAEDSTNPNSMLTPSAPTTQIQPQAGIPAQNPSDAGAASMNPTDNNAAALPPAASSEGPSSDSAPADVDTSIPGLNDDKSGAADPSAIISSEPDAPVDAD